MPTLLTKGSFGNCTVGVIISNNQVNSHGARDDFDQLTLREFVNEPTTDDIDNDQAQ